MRRGSGRGEGIVGGRVLSRWESQGETSHGGGWGDKPRGGWPLTGGEPLFLSWSKWLVPVGRLGSEVGSPRYCARLEEGVIVEPMEGGRVPVCVTVCLKGGEVRIPPSLLANRTRESPGCCFPGLLFCLVIPGFQEVSGHVVWNGLWE